MVLKRERHLRLRCMPTHAVLKPPPMTPPRPPRGPPSRRPNGRWRRDSPAEKIDTLPCHETRGQLRGGRWRANISAVVVDGEEDIPRCESNIVKRSLR